MNIENDGLFGPATDLVISLFSISLILVGIISGLYLESENERKLSLEQIEQIEQIEQTSKSNNEQLIKDNEATIEVLNTELTKLNERLDRKNTDYEELNKRLAKKNTDYEELNKRLAKKNTDYEELNKRLAKKNTDYEELNKRLAKKNTDYEELNKRLAKKNTDYEELNKSQAKKNTDYEKLNQKLANKDLEFDKLRKEHNTLKKNIAFTCKDGDLKKCGGSTKVPKRSREGKFVVFLIQNSNDNDDLKYKYNGQDYIYISRNEAHKRLKSLMLQYGSKLYVATDADKNVAWGRLSQLICEFRQYDYYQFHDPRDCR